MTGYRSRATKPTVFLWTLIVFANAGFSVASGTTALVTAFTVGGVVVLLLLAGRFIAAAHPPVPARQPIPVHRPSRAQVHRRREAVPRLGVRHRTS